MITSKLLTVAALVAVVIVPSYAHPAVAGVAESQDAPGLSPYWRPVIRRWDHLVVEYAHRRRIDPDLVASVVWKESRGDPAAVGPTGAIGLMCVKPFAWRPSAAELENPSTNVASGTGIMQQVIEDGKGDVYYALAAYNGGWDKIHRPWTGAYAADVLGEYVRAVAVQQGLASDGEWFAILAVEGLPDNRTITVLGPHRPLTRYTERPLGADIPSVPLGQPPDVTVASFSGPWGREARVNLWLVEEDSR